MRKITVFLLTLLCLFTFSLSTNNVVTAAELSTYYAGTENLTGDALLNKLAEITKLNHKTYNTYGETRYVAAKTDGDPNNSSNFLDLYTKISVNASWDGGNTWNREHVWCKSLSGGLFTSVDNNSRGAGADIHHIRPTYESINSSRSNKLYTDFSFINQTGTAKYYNGVLAAYQNSSYWEPIDDVKGDIARILMYLYMHYSTEVSYNKTKHANYSGNLRITSIVYAGGTAAKSWNLLLNWNDLDPVDDFEANRNEECAKITGTRNPFIDNMDFCDAIWGSNATPQQTYTVSYNVKDGASFNYSDTTKYVSGSKVKEPSEEPTLDGHTFVGWYKDSNYTTKWDFSRDGITSNLNLYAKFVSNDVAEFETIFNSLSIKSQLTFEVFKDTVYENSLKLNYVIKLTDEQYDSYSSVASDVKFYINNSEASLEVVKLTEGYQLVYSVKVVDNSTVYVPTLKFNNLTVSIAGYSAKTLAAYYLTNLSSDNLVVNYKQFLSQISK